MPRPKKILNDPADSVEEFCQGLLLQYPNKIQKLENHHVLLAADRSSDQVALLSGGGSGHEPSHAGWLGQGMLSVAVCGGIFASPSVASVLAGIRAVGSSQVLMIVKNYTGDRLNFGMAAEKARKECRMVVVADDCALPRTKGITGARGVAGTVLVHKIAGAAASAGLLLDDVAQVAEQVCARMGTLGVAMDSVTVPGAEAVNDRLDDATIEIGLGIHGEAGMKQSPLKTADELAAEMIETIQKHGRMENGTVVPLFEKGDEVVVLVNNLGGTSNFEMSILARSCIELLEGSTYGVKATRVLVGSYMTSFDMHGASITILNVQGQPKLVEYLDAPTTAPAWSQYDVWKSGLSRPSSTLIPDRAEEEEVTAAPRPTLDIADFASVATDMIRKAATKLAEAEPLLTKYDTIVGDGDCGITMKRGALEVLSRLDGHTLVVDHPVPLFHTLADAVSASMGGTSGILMELMFRKMSSYLSRVETVDSSAMATAFEAGVDAVSLYGGAQVGARTMLDALVPAAKTLSGSSGMKGASVAARAGADSTALMSQASAGRSNYLSEDSLSGTPDPGAVAAAIVFEAIV